MSDLGTRIRDLVDRTAPPVDSSAIVRGSGHATSRSGWTLALGAGVVVLAIGALTFAMMAWRPNSAAPAGVSTTESSEDTTTTAQATTVTSMVDPVTHPTPVGVTCSEEFPNFPCSALLDPDPGDEWQVRNGGIGASVTFTFARPVALSSIEFTNIEDDVRFLRNMRIRTVEISTDDLAALIVGELPDSNHGPHVVPIESHATSVLTITVTRAYASQSVDGLEPFLELALAYVSFVGKFVDESLIAPGDGPVVSESMTVFGSPWVIHCLGAEPSIRTGEGDGTGHETPDTALAYFVVGFDGSPPIARIGYIEMSFVDGRDGYLYGIPFNGLQRVDLEEATFGTVDDQGEPAAGLDGRFVTLITVKPAGDVWTVTSWEASGC